MYINMKLSPENDLNSWAFRFKFYSDEFHLFCCDRTFWMIQQISEYLRGAPSVSAHLLNQCAGRAHLSQLLPLCLYPHADMEGFVVGLALLHTHGLVAFSLNELLRLHTPHIRRLLWWRRKAASAGQLITFMAGWGITGQGPWGGMRRMSALGPTRRLLGQNSQAWVQESVCFESSSGDSEVYT